MRKTRSRSRRQRRRKRKNPKIRETGMNLKSSNSAFCFVVLAVFAGTELEGRFAHDVALMTVVTEGTESGMQQSGDKGAQEHPDSKARLAKNLRYNGGKCDLTQAEEGCFMEQYESRALPFIPWEEGKIVFKGQVSKVQSYLSEDRTHIYTETTWKVQEIFKQPKDFTLSSDETISTDQIGGVIKIASG